MPLQPISKDLKQFLSDVDLHFWALTETAGELELMLAGNPCLTQPPYVNFKAEKRRAEWLAVRVLLHRVCGENVDIRYEESGRPYLQPHLSEFSVSHTKGVVAIAFSRQQVGIDVEQIGSRAYLLVSHFLQEDEFDFSSVAYPELMAHFMWSAKESVYKLVDLPGIGLKEDIRLRAVQVNPESMEFTSEVNGVDQGIRVRCFQMDGFVLTVATFQA